MDRNVTWVVMVYAVVMCACGAAYEPSGGEPESGIYALTIEGDTDACAPARPTGVVGKMAVIAGADGLDVMVPDSLGAAGATSRIALGAAPGAHASSEMALPGCDGASVHRDWTLLDATRGTVEVAYTEAWTGVGSCALSEPSMPTGDCRADQRLRFDEHRACAAPCEIVWAPTTGALECSCR